MAPAGSRKPQRGEALACGLRAQAGIGAARAARPRRAGDGEKSRSWIRRHLPRLLPPLGDDGVGRVRSGARARGRSRRRSDSAVGMRWVRRRRNSWMPVLEGPQAGGGVVEGRRRPRGRRSRLGRARRAPSRVVPERSESSDRPSHQLEQLHAELDVTQTARPELELAVGLGGGHVLLDAFAASTRDVLDEVLSARRPARPSGGRPRGRPLPAHGPPRRAGP